MPLVPPHDVEARYALEKELAGRLRQAPAGERAETYTAVYDRFFDKFPDPPYVAEDPDRRQRQVEGRLAFLSRFAGPDDCLVEVGAGDCAFSVRAASLVRRVIAVDVSIVAADVNQSSPNFEFHATDGTDIPVDEGSVDVVFSDQLLEHLHPDDATAHLRSVLRALRPGGTYVCLTPNRWTGPHDVSRFFDEVASGFHLREYSVADIDTEFRRAGFKKLRYYVGGRGRYIAVPARGMRWIEAAFARLPVRLRHVLRDSPLVVMFFGVNVVATT